MDSNASGSRIAFLGVMHAYVPGPSWRVTNGSSVPHE
jgi:hypothetical protein